VELLRTDAEGESPPRRGSPERRPTARGIGYEVALVALAMLLYFGVRHVTAGSLETAFENASRVTRLERALGIDWEHALQAAVLPHEALVTLANWVYIFGHWPVILGAGAALYVYRPRHYHLLRNAMFASGLIGFLFFALFPLAPPRLAEAGLVDTVTERSEAYRALQPPGLTNQYAAFPSLHAGWNLLVGIVLAMVVAGLALRVAALALPVAMGLAVVVTANHYIVDVAAGVVVVLVGLAIAILIQRLQDASTLRADGVSGDRGGRRPDRAAVRRGASGREPPRQAA
jgi:membrane-associated phospholipid phosphatase